MMMGRRPYHCMGNPLTAAPKAATPTVILTTISISSAVSSKCLSSFRDTRASARARRVSRAPPYAPNLPHPGWLPPSSRTTEMSLLSHFPHSRSLFSPFCHAHFPFRTTKAAKAAKAWRLSQLPPPHLEEDCSAGNDARVIPEQEATEGRETAARSTDRSTKAQAQAQAHGLRQG